MKPGLVEIHVAIIEDNRTYRDELISFLKRQKGMLSISGFDSIEDFLKHRMVNIPNIILIDVGLPGMSGVKGIIPIKAKYPMADIAMLTIFCDNETIFQSLRFGAVGYLVKDNEPEEILKTITALCNGGSYMSPSVARQVINYFTPSPTNIGTLTNREKEIALAIADGLSYKLIADQLGVKLNTIQGYIKNIYRKLNVHSKTEVIGKITRKLP